VDTAVTGITAVGIDVSKQLSGGLLPFAILVVGISLVLLAMVFRSIWVQQSFCLRATTNTRRSAPPPPLMISVPASMAAPLIGAIGGRLSWSVHIGVTTLAALEFEP